MSNCCSSNGSEQQGSSTAECPTCGLKGKAVPTLTVKNLVINHVRVAKDDSYSFCRTPNCNVVYFAPSSVFGKADIKVRVGLLRLPSSMLSAEPVFLIKDAILLPLMVVFLAASLVGMYLGYRVHRRPWALVLAS